MCEVLQNTWLDGNKYIATFIDELYKIYNSVFYEGKNLEV